jgi:hypothetical protein
MIQHILRDDTYIQHTAETEDSIYLSLEYSGVNGQYQCLYTHWLKLSGGDYAVYRNWFYEYDYEGRGLVEHHSMFIQEKRPTLDDCVNALFAWINERIDQDNEREMNRK